MKLHGVTPEHVWRISDLLVSRKNPQDLRDRSGTSIRMKIV